MRDRSLDVAITGLHARLPGPEDVEKWWAAVCAGETMTTHLGPSTLAAMGVPEHVYGGPDYVPVRGCIQDSDRFDAELFGISPREAELIDPQHRLMLEASWAALEDAGCDPLADRLRTAVFASSSTSRYMARIVAGEHVSPDVLESLTVGAGRDFMAARIAYRLGLEGPAVGVLTACSSSLVAVHLAVQALNSGDCDQAVVVAAAVGFPQAGYTHVRGGIMSVDGQCRPFDARATGTVGGSGVVAVVLRRFDDVRADVPSHGVILGSAVNNDGSAKAGFNAPSARGQVAAIRAALRAGDVAPSSLGYVEAHGTGTYVGDPIEWSAMSTALREAGTDGGRIAVGAVKANIGHLDAAAGLASVFKVLQVLRHGQVPPVANFSALNPLLTDGDSPLYVPTEVGEWSGPAPRRAGISSFGIGGTNAHLVVEEAPPQPARARPVPDRPSVVVLSGIRPSGVDRAAALLAEHLADHEVALPDVAYTLRVGRAALPERLAVAGRSRADLAEALRAGVRQVRGRVPEGGPRPLVVLFPGQGAQRPGMALPFLDGLPGFSAALDDCLGHFEPTLAALVREALCDNDFPAERMNATGLAQPALFAVEYAAAQALLQLGVRPAAYAGHSLGELTAACLAGALDLATAAELVVLRASAMQSCPTGAMVAVACSEDEARALAADTRLELAAVNSPSGCVLSGPVDAVEALARRVAGSVPVRRLRTTHAFHSASMEPAVATLRAHLAGRHGNRSTVPFVSTVDGRVVAPGTELPLETFADSARGTVRFADGVAALLDRFPGALAVEVGPGQALSGMVTSVGMDAVPLSPKGDQELALSLAALWVQGQPVDLAPLAPTARRLHLPVSTFGGDLHVAPEAALTPVAARTPVAGPTPAAPVPAVVPASEVAAAWRSLLGRPDLAPESDFYACGGDSLLAVRLLRRLEQTFAVEIPLRDLMLTRTLGGQVRLVQRLLEGSDE